MLLKLFVGFATGSMVILGDAVHSLTDLANNVVAWLVVRWSTRPPDDEHPYGHRKFETVAVFLLAMLLTVTAFELGLRALSRPRPEIVHADWAVVAMLCVLLTNVGLASWQAMWARKLESDILGADARHTFADVLTTIVAIAGWQAAVRGYPWVDTVSALGVALLILFLAYGLFRRSLPVLVDGVSIDPERLEQAALRVSGVVGVRRARSRSYGYRAVVDLVVLVEPDLSTVASHEIATIVEQVIRSEWPVDAVTVHIEPERQETAARH
ncbi:MAG: cation transporter [Deltaproteobacteria bacterium]|nr:cation transporter [Deltaproteobacteria bacterium]